MDAQGEYIYCLGQPLSSHYVAPSATSRTFLGDDLRDSLADPARLERAALLLPTLYSQKDPLLRILILELGDFLGCIQVSEHQWEHLIRANFLSTIQEIASDPAYYKPFNAEREHVSESFVVSSPDFYFFPLCSDISVVAFTSTNLDPPCSVLHFCRREGHARDTS